MKENFQNSLDKVKDGLFRLPLKLVKNSIFVYKVTQKLCAQIGDLEYVKCIHYNT